MDEEMDIREFDLVALDPKKRDELMAKLSPREEKILRLRFAIKEDRKYTLREIAIQFGVSQSRIRQIECRAFNKILNWVVHPPPPGKIDESNKIEFLELSCRARNVLRYAGIEYISQLLEVTEAELLSYKNCGRKSLHEIEDALFDHGMYLNKRRDYRPTGRRGVK